MNGILLAIVALIYVLVAINMLLSNQIGLGCTFICYALSNVFLYISSLNI
jgi:hypothetical protein